MSQRGLVLSASLLVLLVSGCDGTLTNELGDPDREAFGWTTDPDRPWCVCHPKIPDRCRCTEPLPDSALPADPDGGVPLQPDSGSVAEPDTQAPPPPPSADLTPSNPPADSGVPGPEASLPPDQGSTQCASPPKWVADHETGNLSQYTAGGTYGGSFDSDCVRPPSGVVTSPVHGGQYSMKMTAPISAAKPACRQFRYEESSLGHSSSAHSQSNPLYYGVWMYFPEEYSVTSWSNIIQFKTKTYSKDKNDAFWVLELRNRINSQGKSVMYMMLRYKGIYPGPYAGDGTGLKHYSHDQIDLAVPAKKWFHLQMYLKQSTNGSGQQSNYDGHLIVWQDGVEIYNMDKIATRYPDSWTEWSVNVYAETNGVKVGGSPADFTAYVDDVAISDKPVIGCP